MAVEECVAAHDTLLAERDRLRAALEPFAKLAEEGRALSEYHVQEGFLTCSVRVDDLLRAATALKEGE